MFNTDDIVNYGINGVCKIVGIENKCLTGEMKTYFVLKPLSENKSTFYVPVDNNKLLNKMRKLLSEDEIKQLIDSIPNEKAIWIKDERERKESYKQIIANGHHSELISMIKAIYAEKKEREATGKKLHMSDEGFLKDAEKLLYEEFQYVLNISEHDIVSYIFSQIEEDKD